MDPKTGCNNIGIATFESLLSQYPDVVPAGLQQLERERLENIPRSIKSRDSEHITLSELATLMKWKLTHGKFRPTLMSLINKNAAEDVVDVTKEAFSLPLTSEGEVKAALAVLTRLKGVGPATASLLLSVKDPDGTPFFGDELCRWACWDAKSGWKQEIKYTEKVYLLLWKRVQELRARLKQDDGRMIGALEVEKVAYVLGKQTESAGETQKKKGGKRKAMEVEEGANGESVVKSSEPSPETRSTRRKRK
jgi:hypothetical protein